MRFAKILAALLLVTATPLAVRGEVIEQIVAQVNNDIVTLSQFNREKDGLFQALKSRYSGKDLDQQYAEATRQILPLLVDELLLMQKAKEFGFGKDLELEANAYVDDLMKKNSLPNLDALKQAMAAEGVDYKDYMENLKRQILVNRVKGAVIRQRVKILSDDVTQYYRQHSADFGTPESVELEEVVLYTKDKKKEQVDIRAREAADKLKQGFPFAEIAKTYSEGPTASQGGNIGSFPVASLAAPIRNAVKDLKEGQTSGLVETDYGYEIIRLVKRTASRAREIGEVKGEIEDRIFRERFDPVMKDYMSELRSESHIEIFPEFQSYYPMDLLKGITKPQVAAGIEDRTEKGAVKK